MYFNNFKLVCRPSNGWRKKNGLTVTRDSLNFHLICDVFDLICVISRLKGLGYFNLGQILFDEFFGIFEGHFKSAWTFTHSSPDYRSYSMSIKEKFQCGKSLPFRFQTAKATIT